ncbi:MAG: ATP-binding cassette domain-containing protein [Oscillospiraceae bacterium]|nr:ATP-binding cassette domain-containing protein [Oscillospiraceae bacterium]
MIISNLNKAFGNVVVLENFCLELPDSGVVAFMSPSGSGKTTLIRILAGIEKADGGEANVCKKKLSMVFQENRLLPGVTAAGNVMSVLKKGTTREEMAISWLDKMGIKTASHLFPRQLSGGMQRRLSIARAMAYGGDLMILDEPFTGLDTATRKRIYPHIFDETRSKRLTILVTHDRAEAESIADRLIVMGGPPLCVLEDIHLNQQR